MQNGGYPVVTILIATFNSEKVLPRTLDAIEKQSYPREKIEILIVDGGSSDTTLQIAAQHSGRVVPNPYTEPSYAYVYGMQAAQGEYVLVLDHDEVMCNENSILNKVTVLQQHPQCKAVLTSGYVRPQNYPLLNEYISEFGDPYSLFIYNFPKSNGFFEKCLRKHYKVTSDAQNYFCVSFQNMKKQPLIELPCGGTLLEKEFFLPLSNTPDAIALSFYYMLAQGITELAVLKNDPILHYSVDSLKAYWPKLRYRVWNNINQTAAENAGYKGREQFQHSLQYKKYLFVLYTVATLPPLLQGAYLAATRKNPIYLLHPVLCWFVLLQIVYQYGRKLLKKPLSQRSYDGKKKIAKKD